jgi:hypothetical protein
MSPTSYRTAPPRVTEANTQFSTRCPRDQDSVDNFVTQSQQWGSHPERALATGRLSTNSAGKIFADVPPNMEAVVATLLMISSVAVSIGLSRLAVGEMFRLVRIDAPRRPEEPPVA